MLGKAKELKVRCFESWFGDASQTLEVSGQIEQWLDGNESEIISIQYTTYQATGADGHNCYGERAFIIYKEQ